MLIIFHSLFLSHLWIIQTFWFELLVSANVVQHHLLIKAANASLSHTHSKSIFEFYVWFWDELSWILETILLAGGSVSLSNLNPSHYDVCELRPRFLIARHSPPLTCILVLAHRPFTAHNPLNTACLAIYTLLYDSPYPSPPLHVTYSALWTTVVHLLLGSCRHHTIQVPGSDTVEECTRKLFTPDIDLI